MFDFYCGCGNEGFANITKKKRIFKLLAIYWESEKEKKVHENKTPDKTEWCKTGEWNVLLLNAWLINLLPQTLKFVISSVSLVKFEKRQRNQ